MHLFFPAWLRHGRPSAPVSIFSVDIQPFGSRLASAGQDCAVKIWSLSFLADKATLSSTEPTINTAALSDKPPAGALLATLSSHSSAVNCVRWSPDGSLLASAADDTVVLLYELDTQASAAFGQRENWRVRKPLRAHAGDVTDLAWSPDGERLASASVDNLIYIWHVRSHRTLVCLRGHTGLVKGVAWDPVGRYVASQSDDKTVRIWRTSDWKTEKVISKPFDSAVYRENSMAFYLRISWSPCGTQLLCTNACKRAAVHTAPMFSRSSAFDHDIGFMGHREPVISTRFSPRLYRPHPAQVAAASAKKANVDKQKPQDENKQAHAGVEQTENQNASKPSTQGAANLQQPSSTNSSDGQTPTYTCLALGSKDCGATIWKASAVTPFFEIAHLFDSDVIDLAWGTDGYTLVACSTDGSAMYFRFEPQELGEVVSETEMRSILTETWRAFGAGVGSNASARPIAETPSQLRMELTSTERSPNGQSSAKDPIHVETATPKQPTVPTSNDKLPAPVQAAAEAIKKKPTPPADPNFIASQTETRVRGGKRRITPRPVSTVSSTPISASKPPLPNSSSSMFSDAPLETASVPLPSPSKRPRVSAQEASLRGESRVLSATRQQNGVHPSFANGDLAASVRVVPPGAKPVSHAAHLYAPSVMGLSMMLLPDKGDGPGRCRMISRSVPPVMLESKEHHGNGGGYVVLCSSGGNVHWRDFFPKTSPVTALAGIANKFVAVGTADASLFFYSASSGRRLTPPIAIDSAPYILEALAVPQEAKDEDMMSDQEEKAEDWYAVLISRSALCSVFDIKKKQLVCARSAVSLIARPAEKEGQGSLTGRAAFYREISQCRVTTYGEPILILSDGHVFVYSRDFSSWLRVADDNSPNSDYTRIVPTPGPVGILRSLQSARGFDSRPLPSLSGMGDLRRSAVESLAHLESLMESAIVLGSASDYRYYLTNYASRIAAAVSDDVENCIMRLRELCDMLLNSKQPETDSKVLGMSGRKLLKQSVLPVVSTNRQMQRFVAEYTECLDELEKRAAEATTT
ncbi:WD40/YVTN repeat-like containing protein [Gracilaria domingensis]|nr:WD40/YVTN repeat-like containing protein [Gracilaria domingensis]